MRAMFLLALLFVVAMAGAQEIDTYRNVSDEHRLYDTDPEHLWNRLHRTLFARTDGTGAVHGLDEVEILYWHQTNHLLEGPSHEAALAVLDEFLASGGETLVEDPLKRAFLQRDLWALFDWVVGTGHTETKMGAVLRLQQKLVPVIKAVALSEAAIAGLPDTYAEAAASGGFPTTLDVETDGAPYLPPRLLDDDGPWVRICGAAAMRVRYPTYITH